MVHLAPPALWQTERRTTYVLRGRCKSEPAVTVRDPSLAATPGAVDLVELQDRR
jgi:hypothetical protein